MSNHKATIETLINTSAIALTTFGVSCIIERDYYGFIVILFGMSLEFAKYWGRKEKIW
jgi:hypothetical protein